MNKLNIKKEHFYKSNYYDLKRNFEFNLHPSKQSNINVRSFLEYYTQDYKTWQEIAKHYENKNKGVCSYCKQSSANKIINNKEIKHSVECHEVWEFIDDKQVLVDLVSLCVICHNIKHLDQHDKNNKNEKEEEISSTDDISHFDNLLGYYRRYNKLSRDQVLEDYKQACSYRDKINKEYYLDLSFLKKNNILNKSYISDKFDCHSKEFKEFLIEFKSKNNQKKDNNQLTKKK